MIDTHCHLTFPDFEGNLDQVLRSAADVGVTGCITISTTSFDCLDALRVAEAHPHVWCTAGVHPLYADVSRHRGTADLPSATSHVWSNLARVARHPRCVAWGELGLDNHYQDPPAALQRRVLEDQLEYILSVNHCGPAGIGKPDGLPFVLHCREAFSDLIPILSALGVPGDRCVFHCFTGGPAEMKLLLDFGAMVSFTGVATYPSAVELRKAALLAPSDRIMVETDAPFLPPVPHRGKRPCVPAWVVHTAQSLAELRGCSFEDFHDQLNANTQRFFRLK